MFSKRKVFIITILIVIAVSVGALLVSSEEYTLGPGDTLQVISVGEQEQQFTLIVRQDGYITLPLIGEIKVEGMTIQQVTEELTVRYGKYLRNPNITVILVKMRQEMVRVIGEVRSPGVYALLPGSNVIDAIMLAGGPNASADLTGVTVQHRDASEITTVDLSGMVSGNFKTDYIVRNGDIIFISGSTFLVAVIGEVNRPGVYEIRKDGRLLDALTMAGGPTSRAKTGKIAIYSGEELNSDSETVKPIFQGNMMSNPKLVKEQVVYVPRSYIWDIDIVINILSAANLLKSLFGI